MATAHAPILSRTVEDFLTKDNAIFGMEENQVCNGVLYKTATLLFPSILHKVPCHALVRMSIPSVEADFVLSSYLSYDNSTPIICFECFQLEEDLKKNVTIAMDSSGKKKVNFNLNSFPEKQKVVWAIQETSSPDYEATNDRSNPKTVKDIANMLLEQAIKLSDFFIDPNAFTDSHLVQKRAKIFLSVPWTDLKKLSNTLTSTVTGENLDKFINQAPVENNINEDGDGMEL